MLTKSGFAGQGFSSAFRMMFLVLIFSLALLASCGGGGGGGATPPGGGSSAVSGYVPYLISAPTVTYTVSSWNPGYYDVTVTLEADGPTGVAFVSLWILDAADEMNFTSLDLAQDPGTKRWTGTTNTNIPLPPGQYYIDSIVLDDGDSFTADPLRTGWYFIDLFFSTSKYFVDEQEISRSSPDPFLFYNFGVSGISITRFTLP